MAQTHQESPNVWSRDAGNLETKLLKHYHHPRATNLVRKLAFRACMHIVPIMTKLMRDAISITWSRIQKIPQPGWWPAHSP
jgi:hypothetical protein